MSGTISTVPQPLHLPLLQELSSLPAPRLGWHWRRPMQMLHLHWLIAGIVLFSGLDFVFTWLLVDRLQLATEGNPIASWVLVRSGWVGLFSFKVTLMAFAIGVSAWISKKNARTATFVRLFALGASVLVVGYSVSLLVSTDWSETDNEAGEMASFHKPRQIQAHRKMAEEYAIQLAQRKCELASVVATLTKWSAQHHHVCVEDLGLYFQTPSPESTIAADLIMRTSRYPFPTPEAGEARLSELVREYRDRYGMELPEQILVEIHDHFPEWNPSPTILAKGL